MIRVVTFDAAGTLIRLLDSPGRTYAETARLFGYHLDPNRVESAFRLAWKALPPPRESEGPSPDDDRGWWRKLVVRTMEEACYEIVPFDAYFAAVYETFARPGVWELFPEVPELLSRLNSLKVRLGVISNFDRRLYDILAQLDVRNAFEHVIISSEIGARKPEARIFLAAARRFNVAANEILHIGNEPEADFAGALGAGFEALLVGEDRVELSALLSRFQGKGR